MDNRVLKGWLIAAAAFFILMGAATVYSCARHREALPRVELYTAKATEDGSCRVPAAAVSYTPEGAALVMLVREREGAWGTEYVCVQKVVGADVGGEWAVLRGVPDLPYPVAVSASELYDGCAVRLS